MPELITTELQKKLDEYVDDTQNAVKNFELGLEYEKLKQYAPACSYFLRASEITANKDLEYECLIHMAKCFDLQGDRQTSTCQTYRQAMILLPERPEAYYLLCRFYNWNNRYDEAHHLADLALRDCNFERKKLESTDYVDHDLVKVFLTFEKAVSAWWWGKLKLCKDSFDDIIDNHWDDLSDYQKEICKRYDSKFKFHPSWHDPLKYTSDIHHKMRVKFPGSERIIHNASQVYQDLFVLTMLNGKTEGYFVEIGSGGPFYGNNTTLLETGYGWRGMSIELKEKIAKVYSQHRPNVDMHIADVLTFDWSVLHEKEIPDNVIDYLQFDIDPPINTYQSLLDFPLDEFPARVITFEHDYYADEHKRYRTASRHYLRGKGYVLVAGNISPDGKCPFEDWWVHPDYVDPLIIEKMIRLPHTATPQYTDEDTITNVHTYMFDDDQPPTLDEFKGKLILPPGFVENTRIADKEFREKLEKQVVDQENLPEEISFKINQNQKDTVWVVDDFYEDPDAVREYALQQDFHEGGVGRGFIGRRTDKQYLFPGLKEKFENIMGKEITHWEYHSENGKFQNCIAGEPITWHCDSQKWGGLLYLTPNAPYKCGTALYAHKFNRARSYNDKDYEIEWRVPPENGEPVMYGGEHFDGTNFEPVDVMGNIYNRLIIFDASCIHAASEYFGYNLKTGRLWQMFFFDTK